MSKNTVDTLGQALGACLGSLAALLSADHDLVGGQSRSSALAIHTVVDSPGLLQLAVRTQQTLQGQTTLQQLGRVFLPLCILNTETRVHIVRHGDPTLNTHLPVEAVLCLDAVAWQRAILPNVMRVVSIAAVPSYDLRPGETVFTTEIEVSGCLEGLEGRGGGLDDATKTTATGAEALVGHLELFAAVHSATKLAPLRLHYDIFGRHGTIATDQPSTSSAESALSAPMGGHLPVLAASGTSGFSTQVGARKFAASIRLSAVAEVDGATPHKQTSAVVVFDAGGIVESEQAVRKAISKSGWKRRGGFRYRTGSNGELTIDKRGLRITSIVVYLYPTAIGSVSRVVNNSDGTEGMVRAAVNTAISSLRCAEVEAGDRMRGEKDNGGGEVEYAIAMMSAALGNMRQRRAGGGLPGRTGDRQWDWGSSVSKMLRSTEKKNIRGP